MKHPRHPPQLAPLGDRATVEKLGDALIVRSREEGGLLVLSAPDLLALRRTLAEKRSGG